MGDIGIKEILLIAVVALLLFGTKRLPELMRGLGKGLKTFNDGKDSVMDEINNIKNPISSTASKIVKTTKTDATASSISDLDHEPVKKG